MTKSIEAKKDVHTIYEGYILVYPNSSVTAGSRGRDVYAAAMSKEIAEAIMQREAQEGRSAELQQVPNARFIELPGGDIYDNLNHTAYASYEDYIKQRFASF